jgi:hypothetical protein
VLIPAAADDAAIGIRRGSQRRVVLLPAAAGNRCCCLRNPARLPAVGGVARLLLAAAVDAAIGIRRGSQRRVVLLLAAAGGRRCCHRNPARLPPAACHATNTVLCCCQQCSAMLSAATVMPSVVLQDGLKTARDGVMQAELSPERVNGGRANRSQGGGSGAATAESPARVGGVAAIVATSRNQGGGGGVSPENVPPEQAQPRLRVCERDSGRGRRKFCGLILIFLLLLLRGALTVLVGSDSLAVSIGPCRRRGIGSPNLQRTLSITPLGLV